LDHQGVSEVTFSSCLMSFEPIPDATISAKPIGAAALKAAKLGAALIEKLLMNQGPDFKYAPFANPGASVPELPTLSAYRQSIPVLPSTEPALRTRRFERKRLLRWFAVAVALHAALFLGIWLTPPLQLKWSPDPEQWVAVTSLPTKVSEAPPPDAVTVTKPPPTKAKGHKAKPAIEPSPAQSAAPPPAAE
jgi:hypothetical protein